MSENNVITSLLNDLALEQPINSALCVGQDLRGCRAQMADHADHIVWQYFNAIELLKLPFQQRFDLAVVMLDRAETAILNHAEKTQLLVKCRDLLGKRLLVVAKREDEALLRSLGLTQLIDKDSHQFDFALWQFNILTYKQVPDWLNAKFWANPENWDKYRW